MRVVIDMLQIKRGILETFLSITLLASCLTILLSISSIAHAAAIFKGVQSGSFTHTTTNGTRTSQVNLASSIDTSKSYLMFQARHSSTDPGGSMIRGRILNGTTLEFESVYDRSNSINVQWYVVEYNSGVRVQRGTISQSGTTVNASIPLTLSAVNQAFVTWSKTPLGSDSSFSSDDPIVGQITSTSNVQFRASGSNANHIIWWQVIEYTDPTDINVQTILTSMTGNQTNRNISISAVDRSKSFVLAGYRSSGSGNDIDERMMSAEFNSSTQVRIRRGGSGDNMEEVVLQVVQLNDGVVIQGGETRMRSGDFTEVDSLSAITPANSIAFGSVQPSSGQSMGRVDYDSNDLIGEGAATFTLSASQITLQRNSANDDARFGWFVLDFTAVPSSSPPEITSVNGSCVAMEEVTVVFNEDVEQSSAETVSNYQLVNASGSIIALNTATRTASNAVTLDAAVTLNDLTQYTLTVNNVEDLGGDVIAANSSDAFSLSCQTNCFVENFSGPGALSSDWYATGSAGSFGTPRVVRDGAMRLTDASGSVATVANLLLQFPGAENRIEVEFDYFAYSGSGADGIAVTFSDATVTPVPGSYGGALGYAQRNNGTAGFAGGWLGVGIDEYGNFSAANEGKQGGSGFARDAVALRGSGSGTSGYPYLTSTGTLSPGIDQGGSSPAPGHRYKIILDHTVGGGQAYVEVQRDTGAGYSTIIPSFDVFAVNPSQAAVPADWVVSFTGSTGGATNIHEIENLQICAAQPIATYNLIDHYHISHGGTGLTCEAESVTVTAHDASHNAVTVNSNTALTISTSPAVDAVIPASPVILAGDSAVTFDLNQGTASAAIDIDVTDGSATDLDDGSSEDLPIAFVDTAFRFYANGTHTGSSPIGTQISGKDSNTGSGSQSLTIRAVQTNTDTGACEAALQGLTDVGIAYECNSPTSCTAGNRMTVEGNISSSLGGTNNGASLSYTDVELNFNASGEAPFFFGFEDVGLLTLYAHLDVAASLPEPAFSLDGSSNAFVVRPFGFDIDFGGQRSADWADDGALNDSTGSNTSYAADGSGSVIQAAGDNVTIQVRAVQWQQSDDVNNDGVPDNGVDLSDNNTTPNFGNEASAAGTLSFSHSLNQPATGDAGALSAASLTVGGVGSDFSAGVAATIFSWDEVGIIDLSANLGNYLADPNADANGVAANVGRFVPSYFDVVASNGALASACGTFSYIGQSTTYAVGAVPSATITARNAGGGVTENYTDTNFLKMTALDVARGFPTADTTTNGADAATLMSLTSLVNSGSLTVSSAGVLDYQFDTADSYIYTKNLNSLVGPFTSSFDITVSALDDSDSVSAALLPTWTPTGVELRYGRWRTENVFGPESDDLLMFGQTEYLNAGGDFVLNTADSCTNITAGISVTDSSGASVSSPYNSITVGDGSSALTFDGPVSGGLASLTFAQPGLAAPGDDHSGSIDFEVDLTALPWLRFNWDGSVDGSLEDAPVSAATFGQYRGHDRIIYWREIQ